MNGIPLVSEFESAERRPAIGLAAGQVAASLADPRPRSRMK